MRGHIDVVVALGSGPAEKWPGKKVADNKIEPWREKKGDGKKNGKLTKRLAQQNKLAMKKKQMDKKTRSLIDFFY